MPNIFVTPDQFKALRCNRCGQCCEAFYLPPMLTFVDVCEWALHDCSRGLPVIRADAHRRMGVGHDGDCAPLQGSQSETSRRSNMRPVLFHRGPGDLPARTPCDARDRKWHSQQRLLAQWLMQLEPIESGDIRFQYRCPRFERIDGDGVCTRYEERPNVCSQFPYGFAHPQYDACSWNVAMIGKRSLLEEPTAKEERSHAAA